jgi:hypothetical protein
MNKKNLLTTSGLDNIFEQISKHLEKAIENLEHAGEKYEGHKMWYLVRGSLGHKIKEMIHQLQELIIEIDNLISKTKKRNS